MSVGIKIEGIERMERDLQQFPINADKVVAKAMRKGGNAAAKVIRQKAPSWFRPVVGSKVYTKGHGATCMVGLFLGKEKKNIESDDDYIPIWWKAYWSNYGTLENRDPGHQFSRRRKNKTKDWKGGIKPQHWFEKIQHSGDDIFVIMMEKEYDKLIKRVWENGGKTV